MVLPQQLPGAPEQEQHQRGRETIEEAAPMKGISARGRIP